jgi:hypothetical protein
MVTHRLLGHELSLLERTPTLQHLTWRHLTPGLLAPGILPPLHLLRADVLDSPRATSCCPVEHSPRWALCVCCAVLARRGGAEIIALLVRTVRLFGRLRWLRVPVVDHWHEDAPVTPAPVHSMRVVLVLAHKRCFISRELIG